MYEMSHQKFIAKLNRLGIKKYYVDFEQRRWIYCNIVYWKRKWSIRLFGKKFILMVE